MILVTGANGFVGRNTVEKLIGRTPVRALVHSNDEAIRHLQGDTSKLEIMKGDVRDKGTLRRALNGVETVIHLAAKTVDHDGSGFFEINYEGTRRLLAVALDAGVQKILYLSTVGVYGHDPHHEADETAFVDPDTPYSRSRFEAENLILEQHYNGNLQAVILRPRFVYGNGDTLFLPRLIRTARKMPFMVDQGKSKTSLVWVDDLARLFRILAVEDFARAEHPIYHVTDGVPISFRDLVGELAGVFGFQPPQRSVPYRLLYSAVRVREILTGTDPESSSGGLSSLRLKLMARDQSFSNEKLMWLLPDFQFASFFEGLSLSIDHYRSQL